MELLMLMQMLMQLVMQLLSGMALGAGFALAQAWVAKRLAK